MNLPVGLRIMYCQSSPSGTGSYNYSGRYEVIVKNLAYEKKVSIWKQKCSYSTEWNDVPLSYAESFPNDLEKWEGAASEGLHDFDVKYEVNNSTYWDNNNGWNYRAPEVHDEFAVVTGREFPIVHGDSSYDNSKLIVYVAIQNLAYQKCVGLVYTTDNWKTHQEVIGNYLWTMVSGIEVWKIQQSLITSSNIEFALFYRVNGTEYWDNNFSQNYIITPATKSLRKSTTGISGIELWERTVRKEPIPKFQEIRQPEIEEPETEPEEEKPELVTTE